MATRGSYTETVIAVMKAREAIMALSKDEQALLDQMEAALAQDDPKLANTLSGTTSRRVHRRRAALAGVAFVLGVVCLVVGMNSHWVVSVVGFVIMLAATVVAISAWQRVSPEGGGDQAKNRPPRPTASPAPDVMDKLEDRWRRRQEGEL